MEKKLSQLKTKLREINDLNAVGVLLSFIFGQITLHFGFSLACQG